MGVPTTNLSDVCWHQLSSGVSSVVIFNLTSMLYTSYYASGIHGVNEDATPSEILAAFKSLKRRRWAIEDKRVEIAHSLDMIAVDAKPSDPPLRRVKPRCHRDI
ncbi:hypothetical protein Ae201684P_014407 [Aphanomyces euteiches]|nr:hypothetical protein Ae201684P_014407 [Aphanomyces euteiches]